MSGSGGSGLGGGGGGLPDDCPSLTERTSLSSPVQAVLATLAVGDILLLRIDPKNQRTLLAVTRGGLTAGSITSRLQPSFMRCIDSGYAYIARIVSLSGGLCEVEIRPESLS